MILTPRKRQGSNAGLPSPRRRERKLTDRQQTLNSMWPAAAENVAGPRFWLTGIAFVPVYLALNVMTARYQFHALGVTLWSPDDGLTVWLLLLGVKFLPFVLVGAVLADLLITHVQHSLYITLLAEIGVSAGYVALAVVLRDVLKFSLRRVDLTDVLVMLLAVPAAAILNSLIYCGILYLAGSLPGDQFAPAMRHFWIGDTVGIIAILPAATAVYVISSKTRWVWRRKDTLDWSVFIVSSVAAIAAIHGTSGAYAYHLFYLLFSPIIWIGMRTGYAGTALALLAIQTAFFINASHVGITDDDFDQLQILMLVLSITGLMLGAAVTERERANQRLRAQQGELVRVSAQATAGAMGMLLAHELSQPLSTVATYALAARRMLQSGAASEPVMDALRKAEAEAQRTRKVVERIRDLVSVGRMEPAEVNLTEAASKIRTLCIEGASARGVDIAVECARPIPLIKADLIGIEQVLNNMVGNAVDAAAERRDGRGRVVVRLTSGEDWVTVEIEDNGAGVAPEMAKSLFEAYQTTKPRGFGLGLTLSRQIVRRHGGRISWRPLAPQGTRFIIELNIRGPTEGAE
jgi:two-component system, LuxR family, sensor kinase FixL